jgi:hypothetical protein
LSTCTRFHTLKDSISLSSWLVLPKPELGSSMDYQLTHSQVKMVSSLPKV